MESNLGFMEYELCKEWKLTPKELGEKRRNDPEGVAFLELSMIHRWKKEEEARKEAERKARAKKPRRR